jgi:two-component sensor histidine kinase
MSELHPEQGEDQLLVDRIRFAGKIAFAGIVVQMATAWLLHSTDRLDVIAVQGTNALIVALALGYLGSPSERTRNLLLMFIGYAATAFAAGGVGVLAGDHMTSVLVIFACALATSAVVPWGPWWQGAGALVSLAAAVLTVAMVADFPPTFIWQNAASLFPLLAGTVLVSAVFDRQREHAVEAELDRNVREDSLMATKRRLEDEVEEHRRTEDVLRFALSELDHRVKNTLATVQSVAQRTLASSKSPEDFAEAFDGRIHAMARVHEALAARKWDGLAVRDLVELVVGPYRLHDDSISIMCDEGFISSDMARMLSMTLHELATNASKYGALSTRDGHLQISSRIEAADPARLLIEWKESNGPVVADPAYRGFGTTLIEEAISYEADGVATLEFPPSGVCCEIEIPLPQPTAA